MRTPERVEEISWPGLDTEALDTLEREHQADPLARLDGVEVRGGRDRTTSPAHSRSSAMERGRQRERLAQSALRLDDDVDVDRADLQPDASLPQERQPGRSEDVALVEAALSVRRPPSGGRRGRPRSRRERPAESRVAVLEHRLAVRDQHTLDRELEQGRKSVAELGVATPGGSHDSGTGRRRRTRRRGGRPRGRAPRAPAPTARPRSRAPLGSASTPAGSRSPGRKTFARRPARRSIGARARDAAWSRPR